MNILSTQHSTKIFALVDCNNFFVSCERVFNPSLTERPVIVLSSNDGCCISRSQEAKALGIKMGAPFWQIKELVAKEKVAVFSANFELYDDISKRIMNYLYEYSPDIETYSIDEAFLHLARDPQELVSLAGDIKTAIFRFTGIPISIGLARTKTLAKLGSAIAKQSPAQKGITDLINCSPAQLHSILSNTPIGDIWGIGRESARKLQQQGIYSATELIATPELVLKQILGIQGQKIALELQGVSCLSLESMKPLKQGICSSQSFAHPLTNQVFLEESLRHHLDLACHKLRLSHAKATTLTLFLVAKPNDLTPTPTYHTATINLPVASDYPPDFFTPAKQALTKLVSPAYRYTKLGVTLRQIATDQHVQQHLFASEQNQTIDTKTQTLTCIDAIRRRYGREKIQFGLISSQKTWRAKKQYLSPRYTTRVTEIIEAH